MNNEWRAVEEHSRQTQEGSRRLLLLGAVVAIAFFAGATYFSKPREAPAPLRAIDASLIRQPSIQAPRPDAPQASAYRAPAAGTGRQSYVGVYECVINGQRVVSDRPCGADAEARTLVVDQSDPAEAARQRQQIWATQQSAAASTTSRTSQTGGGSSARTASPSNQAACESIEGQIESIDARMRKRYTSQQGEWYRAQLRALKERRYEYGCLGGR